MAEKDPVVAFKYGIEVSGVISGFFTEASGLGSESEVVEHKVQRGGKELVIKQPGRLKWGDIELKRGITDNMDFWDWRKLVEEGKLADARKNGSIICYDQEDAEVVRYNFVNAWPSKVTGTALAAGSNEVSIEAITIVHEGIVRVT